MSNVYDRFRDIQSSKASCYDKISASFITEGTYSIDITHVRIDETKKAAIAFKEKEGPDQLTIFTLKDVESYKNLAKGDYFIYDSTYYLVYEKVKLIDEDIIYLKHKARECNVSFSINGTTFYGYFVNSLDKFQGTSLEKSFLITDNQKPILIVPNDVLFDVGVKINIGNKPWKIIDFDNITNSGICYISLETSFEIKEENIEPIEEDVEDLESLNTLNPLKEYQFDTQLGYFASVPKVEIIERKSTYVKFIIPINVSSISISIKNEIGEIVTTEYTVVL